MSRTPRTARARTSVNGVGAMRFQPSAVAVAKNDPALQINKLQASSPPVNNSTGRDANNKEQYYLDQIKKLKEQIAALQKQVAQLKKDVRSKSDECDKLRETLDSKTRELEEMAVEHEQVVASLTEQLKLAAQQQQQSEQEFSDANSRHQSEINLLKESHQTEMEEMANSHNAQIAEKDEKIEILKKQMAEILGKNSQERQQQLDELKRDLMQRAEEARDLQHQLKNFVAKSKQCKNCTRLQTMLDEKTLQVRLKQKTIDDLQGIGRRMQIQLQQQDVILQTWEDREEREAAGGE